LLFYCVIHTLLNELYAKDILARRCGSIICYFSVFTIYIILLLWIISVLSRIIWRNLLNLSLWLFNYLGNIIVNLFGLWIWDYLRRNSLLCWVWGILIFLLINYKWIRVWKWIEPCMAYILIVLIFSRIYSLWDNFWILNLLNILFFLIFIIWILINASKIGLFFLFIYFIIA